MIKALARAHRLRRRIERGQTRSLTGLAAQERVTDTYIFRLLPLSQVALAIVERILAGRTTAERRLQQCLGASLIFHPWVAGSDRLVLTDRDGPDQHQPRDT